MEEAGSLGSVPVLLLGFNRPTEIRRVLEAISRGAVSELLVWLDGPRQGNERDLDLCQSVRELVDNANFDFPVKTFYNEINLGCRDSVSSGISWFFSEVEAGAVLEDDCLPSPDFFSYMSSLLERYREDERVFTVAGHMLNPAWRRKPYPYHFSRYPHIWGWGTWRRVWQYYDPAIPAWGELRKTRWLEDDLGMTRDAARYWRYQFDAVWKGELDTWDHQLAFLSLSHEALNVVPHANLVSNIGFGPQATHTRSTKHNVPLSEVHPLGKVSYEGEVELDGEEDRRTEIEIFRTKRPLWELFRIVFRKFLVRRKRKRSTVAQLAQTTAE